MKTLIDKLNAVPMLILSGACLLAGFLAEYIFPLLGLDWSFPANPAWISLFISGTPLTYLALVRTCSGRITSPLLITIAMVAAVCIGDIFAAGEVAFIMAIGAYLEDRTVEKAKRGIAQLISLVPNEARKITSSAVAGREQMIVAKDIVTGDILRILPGESFPADGVITDGETSVDQSIITGESLPVDKSIGDEVFTGTINRFGSVDIIVNRAFANSSLQQMIRLVEEAENKKAPTQKIVDQWAGYLVPAACGIAIATYLIFAYGLGQADAALIRAVTVLVVFCPCALALATPTSIMAAVGQAAKNGVLIKSGEALEMMGRVDTIAFDKTGTLTHGKLSVTDMAPIELSAQELLSLAATVECRSEHPIARAITHYADEVGAMTLTLSDFKMEVGMGVCAVVQGERIYCGNERIIPEHLDIEADIIHTWREQGKAVIIVATNSRVLGFIALSDSMKKSSPSAIASLASAGIKQCVLLTGDNEQSAKFIAQQAGISDVSAALLPEGKVEAIQGFLVEGKQVCMVGDGINDAPALKTASVGIAMGSMGSDIAIEAADIAIMGDDLSKIAYLKRLSNATISSIKFNIALAMGINLVAIVLSVMGILSPTTGALVHNAGSVLVVLNAARLYDRKLL